MSHKTGSVVSLEMPISLSYGLPTKLMMIKASSHHSIAAEIRRESKRKPTNSVSRNRNVTLKPIKFAAVVTIFSHEKIDFIGQ